MFNSKKANEVRTILLLKSESEIEHFTKSKMLINTISPKELYNLYSNIEIVIKNTLEFSTKKSKENQKKFYDDSHLLEQEVYSPYMEIFRKINKIVISEKKNQTFYDRLDLDDKEKDKIIIENKNLDSTRSIINYKTPKEILSKSEDKSHSSIKFLRQKAQNLINIIIRKKTRFKTHSKSFYHNTQFRSQANLRAVNRTNKKKHSDYLKCKNIQEFKIIENEIINCPNETFVSGIEEKNSNENYYKHSTFRSSTNLTNKNDFISKVSQVSFSNRINNTNGVFINNKVNFNIPNNPKSPSKYSKFAKKSTL